MKKFLALSLSNVVFIMLINVKNSTSVGILTVIYGQDKLHAQLGWVWKTFYQLPLVSTALLHVAW